MTFAGAIFLIVAGAILRYGVNLHIEWLNERIVGLILIVAGLVGLVVAFFQTLVFAGRRRRTDAYYDEPRY
jgi:hypothetical protein